ncbi:ABC transporter ATP-binding protein [Erysipelotrichaceae bacterium]|nr:ABC transporter ATP-binding protein [Erysipelotrichaceae bacterium]
MLLTIKNGGKQIEKKAITLEILKDINLEIAQGDLIAITGPSGSGKTSLLNIIGLIDTLSSGGYFHEGVDITDYPDSKRAKLRNQTFGFVLQQFALLTDYSVFENIAIPLQIAGVGKKQIKKTITAMLNQLAIYGQREKTPDELSGGQQQRVAIARALINKPTIILADEPTGSLDSESGMLVMDLLLKAQSENNTVIIVTHDQNIASKCKRQIIMKDGKISADIRR